MDAGDLEMIELLYDCGADPFLENCEGGDAPFDIALEEEMDSYVELFLLDTDASHNEFIKAWHAGYGDIAFERLQQWIQKNGRLPEDVAKDYFFLGAYLHEERLLKFLIDRKYDHKTINAQGTTSCLVAMMERAKRCIELLEPRLYEVEALKQKILGHVCEFDEEIKIGTHTFSVGGAKPPIMYKVIANSLQNYALPYLRNDPQAAIPARKNRNHLIFSRVFQDKTPPLLPLFGVFGILKKSEY